MRKKTIAATSKETGIAKEVLRKWEDRYGFPSPARDATGNRTYQQDQIDRLKLVKTLIDQGMRPGEIVPLELVALQALIQPKGIASADAVMGSRIATDLLRWLHLHDAELLTNELRAHIARSGLQAFILDALPVMNNAVGMAWITGQVSIPQEHLYTEVVQRLLRERSPAIVLSATSPRILFATPPGELHTLGILMAEAVLAMEGASCISLGAQLPSEDIVLAAAEYRADIVCLSFSGNYPGRRASSFLKDLRRQLPAHVDLWAGGAAAARLEAKPRGVSIYLHLTEAIAALQKYRRRCNAALSGLH